MKNLFITLVLLALVLVAEAQNLASDIDQINKNFLQLNKRVEMVTTISFADGRPSQVQKAIISMENINHYHLKMDEIEVLVTPNFSIFISHYDRSIQIDSNNKRSVETLPLEMLDSILKVTQDVQRISLSSGVERYIVKPHFGAAQKVVLEVEQEPKLLNKIELTGLPNSSGKNDVLKMEYSYSDIGQGVPPASEFIQLDPNDKVIPISKYVDYEFSNYYNP